MGGEEKGGARLSPGTFPDPPHALLPTHISSQKGSLDFVWLITKWTSLYSQNSRLRSLLVYRGPELLLCFVLK